jgi:hypothetical protein
MEGSWHPVRSTAKDDAAKREALMFPQTIAEGAQRSEQTNGRCRCRVSQ